MDFLDILTEINSIKYLSNSATDEFKANLPDDARKRLELRQVENHAKARQALNKLSTGVKKDHGKDGIICLQKTLVGLGLRPLLEEAPMLETAPDVKAKDYKNFYNHAVYQNILPLCQLAYLYEKNGLPEDHAFKLATLFKDEKKIHAYLLHFKQSNPYRALVHDACLFELPPFEACEFQRWKEIANRTQNNMPVWMLNPRFRDLLPHAPALERIERSGMDEVEQSKKILDKEVIQGMEKEIAAIRKDYKRVAGKPQVNPTEEEKEQRKKQLSELSAQKSKRRLELATLCAGMTLEEASMTVLQAFYEKYQSGSNAAHQLLVKHGISEKQIAEFNVLKRRNDDQAIPNVVIDGAAIGYSGLYLKKLDTLSDEGAAIAACLGKITNCCQYLGGVGTECVIHGITSPDGGFYVVCKGDAHNPSLDDPILAQSWTWRSQRGALCCDSIEVLPSNEEQKIGQIVDMFRYFADELCRNPKFKRYQVSHINTGSQSGITDEISCNDFSTSTEHAKDYTGYSDSKYQLLLADRAMPYLFYNESQSPTLQKKIQQDTQHFFKAIFDRESPLQDNEPLKQAVAFILHAKRDELLALLESVAGARQEELGYLTEVNRHYLEALNQNRIDFAAFEQGAYLNAINDKGQSALHIALLNNDSGSIIKLANAGINLSIQDNEGNTALHLICNSKDPALLNKLLKHYTKNQLIDVIMAANRKDETVLHKVAFNPELLNEMLVLLPVERLFDAVTMKDQLSQTVLHKAAKYPESLNAILTFLSKEQWLAAVMVSDADAIYRRSTVLHYAAENPESLKIILDLYPKEQRLAATTAVNHERCTVLHYAIKNPESLKIILDLYPQDLRLAATKVATYERRVSPYLGVTFENSTLLHYAADNSDSLKIILDLYPKDQLKEALVVTNFDHLTALHYAAKYPESLKVMLDSLPKEQRFDAVMMANNVARDMTVLHYAAKNPESLKIILGLYPKDQRLEALMKCDRMGRSVLHYAVENPESLKIMLNLLPKEQWLEAITMVINSDFGGGYTIEDPNIALLKLMLEFLPKQQRLEAVMKKDDYGDPVLMFFARKNSETLKMILELLPKDQLVKAVMEENSDGESVLYKAIQKPKLLKMILELLPKDQQLRVVEMTDKDGNTLLHRAKSKPESLKIILGLYPQDQRFKVLNMTNKSCHDVLDSAIELFNQDANFKSLIAILELLPEDQWLTCLRKGFHEGSPGHLPPLVVKLSSFPESKYSLITDYLKIDACIRSEIGDSRRGFYFKTYPTDDLKFKKDFNESQSFDEIKEIIFDYLNRQPDSQLSKRIIQSLLPQSTQDPINELKARWDLSSPAPIQLAL